jgi:hypothetical protein
MKKISHTFRMQLLGLLLFLVAGTVAHAQAPAWRMAVVAGLTSSSTEVKATAVDASGNVYLTGSFAGSIQFGGTTLTSAGGRDIYVAKWSPAQAAFVWALQFGGLQDDVPAAIAFSGTSIYLTGSYVSERADFGSTTLLNPWPLPTTPSPAAFVAKLTDNGAVVWAMSPGGGGGEYIAAAASANSTVLYVVNGRALDKVTDMGASAVRGWRTTIGTYISALAATGNQVYIGGSYNTSTLTLGGTTMTNDFLLGAEIFVAKLVDAGPSSGFVWAQGAKGTGGGNDHVSALAVDGTNVYAAGFFQSPNITFSNIARSGNGFGEVFVGKLSDGSTTSNWTWVQSGGPGGNPSLAVRGPNLYIAGVFIYSTARFGSTVLANTPPQTGTPDAYVAKLTDAGSNGRWEWAQQSNGTGQEWPRAIVVDNNRIYIAGIATSPAAFGSFAFSGSGQVSFLAGLEETPVTASVASGASVAVNLYPNPAKASVKVQLPAISGATEATLTILDGLGRTVRAQTVPTNYSTELDLNGLVRGIYALQITVGTATATRRLVVE